MFKSPEFLHLLWFDKYEPMSLLYVRTKVWISRLYCSRKCSMHILIGSSTGHIDHQQQRPYSILQVTSCKNQYHQTSQESFTVREMLKLEMVEREPNCKQMVQKFNSYFFSIQESPMRAFLSLRLPNCTIQNILKQLLPYLSVHNINSISIITTGLCSIRCLFAIVCVQHVAHSRCFTSERYYKWVCSSRLTI